MTKDRFVLLPKQLHHERQANAKPEAAPRQSV
jgi:hypothetical protein